MQMHNPETGVIAHFVNPKQSGLLKKAGFKKGLPKDTSQVTEQAKTSAEAVEIAEKKTSKKTDK